MSWLKALWFSGSRGWTATEDYWSARWRIIERTKLEFDAAGIEIPYNQMDIYVHHKD